MVHLIYYSRVKVFDFFSPSLDRMLNIKESAQVQLGWLGFSLFPLWKT